MAEAFIVDAVRTPVGRRKGGLAHVHPADLGAHVLNGLVDRTGIDPAAVDDVIFGCLDQIGPQYGAMGRTCWLAAGLPESVPGMTVDRQCGASQQAVHFAAQAVMSGTQDLVIAGGVQSMSIIPLTSAAILGAQFGYDDPFTTSTGWAKRYGTTLLSQFHAADMIAEQWGFTREELDEYAARSHERALAAQAAGAFDEEILPLEGVNSDEGPRPVDRSKIASLQPLREGGRITAATSSQTSDGASALLIASEAGIKQHGLTPRARIHQMTVIGDDPMMILTAPIPATKRALRRSGLSVDDIDRFEFHEAFASIPMATMHEVGADPERTNVLGGAIALGHPLGASGARLMTTLLGELERTGGRYGLQAMCEGGGQANATIIERL